MTIEVEFKFETLSNSQFKFLSVESADTLIAKVRAICELISIDFNVDRKVTRDIIDSYYDDDDARLLKSSSSLRVRKTAGGGARVTFKRPRSGEPEGPLRRTEYEFECGEKEAGQIVGDLAALWQKLNLPDPPVASTGSLVETVIVHNTRQSVPLTTAAGKYEFCYDKYYYFADGKYSEIFGEIEIEALGDQGVDGDRSIMALTKALPALFNFTNHKVSKYARGVKWARGELDCSIQAHTVMLDIVGYSKLTADIQKQLILKLNHHTKEVIAEKVGSEALAEVAYIPTGDGMILVFFSNPERLLPIVIDVQQRIKEHNATSRNPIKFRAAMHSGQVFKYSDINENHNYAGGGINMVARAIGFADAFHIIATKEAFEAMGGTSHTLSKHFHPVGTRQVKHGVAVDLFNVFDRQSDFGNPAPPTP